MSSLRGLTCKKEEVERAKWVSKEELSRMIKEGSFHNYGKEYFDLVFFADSDFRAAKAG